MGPTNALQFAGITLDTALMEARLPEDKLAKCRTQLADFFSRKSVTLKELQAKQMSLLQRFELFCKQGFERTISDSDYENTVKIIRCDSHDKRNSSFSEVSVTDGPAKVNLFRKPDLRRQYRHFRQPLRMMGRRSRDRESSRISLTKLLR